ncbi:sensor histidine kinase [Spirochaetota bacterium]
MKSSSYKKIINDNTILVQLSNRLYRLNSINKILIATRDIIFQLNRPLSNINLIYGKSKSRIFAIGKNTNFIFSLKKISETSGENFILSDIFNLSINKSKIIQKIMKSKDIIIACGKFKKADYIEIYSPIEIFDDFILSNKNIRKMAEKLGKQKLWKKIDFKYFLLIPFYNHSGTFGYITIIGGKNDPAPTQYDLDMFLSIRNIVSNALMNFEYKRLLIDQNRNLEDKNRELARKNEEIEKIEEIERENISQILHDTISQMLAATGISMNILKKELANSYNGKNGRQGKKSTIISRLNHLISQNKDILQITRNIAKTYSPDKIEQKGLVQVIKENIKDMETLYNLQIRYEFPTKGIDIDVLKSSIVYKIIQECFYNILKHSKAKRAILKIHSKNDNLYVFFRDYGVGFDITKLADTETKGIQGMRRKIDILKGRLNIYSSQNKGTIIYFRIPVEL